ncbi:transcriptional regulator CRZ1 [Homalodisca vitripennis]|uniref:transcriptional regulator CRZ1 n=1 Tax=Homalodisca vitripennis TaxID=197043 RepID=UPI001EEC6FA8|nr:transcriptional regulator CRZ1 [Homalodisca vitripennis]XP_046667894.1 transcriptional regulator CRZ1 [Homalodisca vitripennis]KAG8264776.1 hypothetical protein J6590_004799 [Homalodisca vitripennis]
MDISEAFRPEDITKTDFFDFVVAPDVTDNSALQQFNRSMKSVGIFLESYNNNNNNEDPSTERKEANNNHLVLGNGTSDGSAQSPAFTGTPFWSQSSNCDKEAVRWEPSMLEDLNCWSQGGQGDNSSTSKTLTETENTDGAIYTLTVLNGAEQSSTWYRPPEATEEETNRSQSTTSTTLSSHQNSVDLDTFLDSIPSSVVKSLSETTSYQNGYPRTSTELITTVASSDTPLTTTVKSEFAYNDSGYADTKEELCNQLVNEIVLGNNPTGGQFNNNNDWKMSDNNSDRPPPGMDSLLRNALQGKAFLTRYNGNNSIKTKKSDDMRRVLGSPPSTKPPSSEASFSTEMEEDIKTRSPLMAVSLEGGTVVMFDGGGGTGTMLIDSDNPSSAQSMDDIFLSQLDAVSYPEDYEKLKRIENEVAESVEQYCSLDPSSQSIYIPTHLSDGGRLQPIGHLDHSLLNALPSTTSKNKKYTKRSSSSKSPHQLQSPGSSSGIRKERSLHYCNICSKGFKDKYSVNVHIRTHTGEKPFSCSLCGKSFRQKAHLAKHYHTHLAQAKNAANGSTSKPPATKSR